MSVVFSKKLNGNFFRQCNVKIVFRRCYWLKNVELYKILDFRVILRRCVTRIMNVIQFQNHKAALKSRVIHQYMFLTTKTNKANPLTICLLKKYAFLLEF